MRTKANSDNALRGSIQSIENRDHRETSMAMHVLVVANEVGPDVWRLSDQTGYKVADIRKFEYNLRAAGLWRGGFVDSIEWLTEEEDERKMFVLYVQAQVARGLLQRRVEGNFAIYLDHAGHETTRIPIPGGSVSA